MPRPVLNIPPARPAHAPAGNSNPVSQAVAEAVQDMHGVAVVKELKRVMSEPVTPAPNPMGEPVVAAAQAMGALTTTVVTASKGLVDGYQAQSAHSLAHAQFETERRKEAEQDVRYEREQTEQRIAQAREEKGQEQALVLKIVGDQNAQTQQFMMQLGEAKVAAAQATMESQVNRLMERLDYEHKVAALEKQAMQEKLDEANDYIRNRPPTFQEQLFEVVVKQHGGDLAKALPVLLGVGSGIVDPDQQIKLSQAKWYDLALSADIEKRRHDAEGSKAMKEGIGEGVKTLASIGKGLLADAFGISVGADVGGGFVPDAAPPPLENPTGMPIMPTPPAPTHPPLADE